MTKKSNKQSFWDRWRFKSRFVIQNSDTFEAYNLKTFKAKRFSCCLLFFCFLVGGTTLIIAYSPEEYIPGYTVQTFDAISLP